jgi:hypothetical protein
MSTTMANWTAQELERIAETDDLEISSKRADDTYRPFVPIWVVRVGNDLYVRSYKGRDSGWYRHALAAGTGRIRAAGIERDATFMEPGTELAMEIDEAYRTKYSRFGRSFIDPMIAAPARGAALRIDPVGLA